MIVMLHKLVILNPRFRSILQLLKKSDSLFVFSNHSINENHDFEKISRYWTTNVLITKD